MYARTNYPQAEDLRIPTNYAGTALKEQAPESTAQTQAYIDGKSEENTPVGETEACTATPSSARERKRPPFLSFLLGDKETPLSTLFGSVPFIQRFLGDTKEKCGSAALEAEDVWLLLLAAFLFFSDSGDKACALILLAVFLFA